MHVQFRQHRKIRHEFLWYDIHLYAPEVATKTVPKNRRHVTSTPHTPFKSTRSSHHHFFLFSILLVLCAVIDHRPELTPGGQRPLFGVSDERVHIES